jgi:translation initiation factor IF-2
MAQTTIEQFATELKMPAGALIEQLAAAGVAAKKVGDKLTEQDKTRLLDYLRKQHGAAAEPKKRITLTRKQTSEIKAPDASGKARTIQVEVRKKRVLVRRDESDATPVPEEAVAPDVEEAPVVEAPPPVVEAPVEVAPPPPPAPPQAAPERAPAAASPQSHISAAEIASREAESKKQQELFARQQEDVRRKQEDAERRKTKAEEAAKAAAAEAAAKAAAEAKAKAPVEAKKEGTLHRPGREAGRAPRQAREEGDGPGVLGRSRAQARAQAPRRRRDTRVDDGRLAPAEGRLAAIATRRRRRCGAAPVRSSARSWCPRRSRSPTSRTRCRSRPPSSSRC